MKKIRITFSKDTVHVDAYKVGVNEIKSAIHALLIGLHDDFGEEPSELWNVLYDALWDLKIKHGWNIDIRPDKEMGKNRVDDVLCSHARLLHIITHANISATEGEWKEIWSAVKEARKLTKWE